MVAVTSVAINASLTQVWKALTTPQLIKKWLFGTTVISDWLPGSPIIYTGEYQGKQYTDKGIIRKLVPEKLLASTYFSSMSGKEDKPENYSLVSYQLSTIGSQTIVTVTQDNIATEKEKAHVTDNWNIVLGKLKETVENNNE